jgi:hypothetical protein
LKVLWLIAVAAVVIEASNGVFAPQLIALPPAAAEWKLVGHTAIQPSRGLKAWRATYDGAPAMTLTLYLMPWSPDSAWDAIQEWRSTPGAMAFAKGRYFGVAQSPGADQRTLKRFVQGVTVALPPGSETYQ